MRNTRKNISRLFIGRPTSFSRTEMYKIEPWKGYLNFGLPHTVVMHSLLVLMIRSDLKLLIYSTLVNIFDGFKFR